MNTHIKHIGGGWYHIIKNDYAIAMARGKVNAEQRAIKLNQVSCQSAISLADYFTSIIKKENQ
jgi:hypothetical protein